MEDQVPHFNLIDEPWIPVRYADGRSGELGIRETLLTADRIAEIQDASPVVVAAMHRFLLAVLYRALEGPTDGEQAKAWFKQGWPNEKIEAYLQRWHQRFFLFDKHYPFAQVPEYEPKKWHAWTVLAAEHNANNAKVLFDHVDVANAGTISAAKAARWLLAIQSYALGGGNSDFVYTKSSPSANALMAIPIGYSLAETLMFCLVPQNRMVLAGDIPLWEREPESVAMLKSGPQRACAGYADLYLWRTRSLRFRPPSNSTNDVGNVAFASGVGFVATAQVDPMVGYRIAKEGGKFSVQFPERGFWRDFPSLLPDASDLAPRTIENAINLGRAEPSRFPRSVLVTGLVNKPGQAKIEFWRMERFVLPGVANDFRRARVEITQLLLLAESAGDSLNAACRLIARHLLTRGDRKLKEGDITAFLEQMPVSDAYWSSLEARFHQVLREYTEERDFNDVRHLWLTYVRHAVSAAWSAYRVSVSTGDAWAIRALAKAERPVLRRIGLLKQEILKYQPEKEPA